ncbi:CueP family metal-binding protein [Georgenia sp. SYP-B2076]|uniref:CueP family metal-binding protein n=1 Tax=Georgenia sp. SYP-B2076 TaxID=2495881 RepID=UPI000F8E14A8|nr:CueP family metal-binding protein [Georgenia sp. SYP-B2076]
MARRLAATAAGLALVLAGCSSGPGAPEADPMLVQHDLDGLDTTQVIDRLDRLGDDERPTDLTASVRTDELLLSDGTRELSLELPADRFYLSVAPYADQTHECFYHSLTTCHGELGGEDVQVRIVDDATGEVLLDEARTTFENGFTGFWLPRGIDGTITVTHDGRTGEARFSTDADGATCVTTLQVV